METSEKLNTLKEQIADAMDGDRRFNEHLRYSQNDDTAPDWASTEFVRNVGNGWANKQEIRLYVTAPESEDGLYTVDAYVMMLQMQDYRGDASQSWDAIDETFYRFNTELDEHGNIPSDAVSQMLGEVSQLAEAQWDDLPQLLIDQAEGLFMPEGWRFQQVDVEATTPVFHFKGPEGYRMEASVNVGGESAALALYDAEDENIEFDEDRYFGGDIGEMLTECLERADELVGEYLREVHEPTIDEVRFDHKGTHAEVDARINGQNVTLSVEFSARSGVTIDAEDAVEAIRLLGGCDAAVKFTEALSDAVTVAHGQLKSRTRDNDGR